MPTFGQAQYLRANVNSFVGLLFVASFALMIALIIWNAAFDHNPLADFIAQAMAAQTTTSGY
jgi:hypothetical protein